MSALADRGPVVCADQWDKRHRLILNAVVRAEVKLAYGVVKTGLSAIGASAMCSR